MVEYWNMVCLRYGSIINWYWGEFDGPMSSLAALVVMAHVTDGMSAIVDHTSAGRTVVLDIFKSILIFILVGVGNILDTTVLTSAPVLRMTIIFYYLSVEGLIILGNAVHLGLPVPEKLREVLERLRQNRIRAE